MRFFSIDIHAQFTLQQYLLLACEQLDTWTYLNYVKAVTVKHKLQSDIPTKMFYKRTNAQGYLKHVQSSQFQEPHSYRRMKLIRITTYHSKSFH